MTAAEHNFRAGRIRRPHEYSRRIGADGMGFSQFVAAAKTFSETILSPRELKKSFIARPKTKHG